MAYSEESKNKIYEWIKKIYIKNRNLNDIKDILDNDFDDIKVQHNFPEEITINEILDFVEKYLSLLSISEPVVLTNKKTQNNYTPKEDPDSAWQHYKRALKFDTNSLNRIENSTIKLLNHLSISTLNKAAFDTIKGIVIGNVQSGKTANMEALMSMSADYGWNLYILLSGTIENLRRQTETRLKKDLTKNQGLIEWKIIDSRNFDDTPLDSLEVGQGKNNRYFTVCLKNSTRLYNLVKWLHSSPMVAQQLKIIVIDDECDQAGVNTADITQEEKTAIYNMLTNLVNQNNEKNELAQKFGAMNYIGYSATPYANVLNDPSCKSLFPKDFIETLPVSPRYFGPQQIFGYEDDDIKFKGLSIINQITNDDIIKIKAIHNTGDYKLIPKSLEDSIIWFINSLACMRFLNIKKPFSLLIHTSPLTKQHANLAIAIENWFEQNSTDEILEKCEQLWESQTKQFNYELLQQQYETFETTDKTMTSYPQFNDLKEIIRKLFENNSNTKKIDNIELIEIKPEDITQRRKFSEKIHLCIDNCKNNHPEDPSIQIRLAYPSEENNDEIPDCATGFIVIGGATLSRGLTIEGLVSTYFLRTVKLADTLMQMGRWFGYREGYELLPRLWLTDNTKKQFSFLSNMDQKLRNLIRDMQGPDNSPYDYRVKIIKPKDGVNLTPTSKNKMQALLVKRDYTGRYPQTWKFYNDPKILQNNINYLRDFLNLLGTPENSIKGGYCKIWRNNSSETILSFLNKYKVYDELSEVRSMISWLNEENIKNEILPKWNVILAGNQTSSDELGVFKNNDITVNKVNRSMKNEKDTNNIINIGTLVNRKDFLMDINFTDNPELLSEVENAKSFDVKNIRRKSTQKYIPQLVIYIISPNSKPSVKESLDRLPLNTNGIDIVGISINIPEQTGKAGSDDIYDADCYEIDYGFFGVNENID